MTENKTYWVTGPSCIGSVMFPNAVVVTSLKPERIHPAGFCITEESFIWLKAGNCNKFVALPRSTNTLCK